MNLILIFFIAISLSMDAFSLALAYGTISLTKKEINLLSIIVGIYHFVMPILGMFIGKIVLSKINSDILIFIIFTVIGIGMIIESFKKEEKVNKMKLLEMIAFGFAVSVDSFSVGVGLQSITSNYILSSLIFSLTSFTFTYIGLILGNKLNMLIGKLATLIGGISLILLGIFYSI